MGHNGTADPIAIKVSPKDDSSAFRMMVIPVNADGNVPLGEAGYGDDEKLLYMILEGRPLYAHYDRYVLANKLGCESMVGFLREFENSFNGEVVEDYDFFELSDGQTVNIGEC